MLLLNIDNNNKIQIKNKDFLLPVHKKRGVIATLFKGDNKEKRFFNFARENDAKLYTCYLDASQSFDNVDFDILLHKLNTCGFQ